MRKFKKVFAMVLVCAAVMTVMTAATSASNWHWHWLDRGMTNTYSPAVFHNGAWIMYGVTNNSQTSVEITLWRNLNIVDARLIVPRNTSDSLFSSWQQSSNTMWDVQLRPTSGNQGEAWVYIEAR